MCGSVATVERPVATATDRAPAAEPVIDGVWRVAFPRPDAFGGSVAAYLLADGDALVLVDAGVPGEQPWEHLERAIADIGRPGARIDRVLLTHGHWDHCGLVPLLVARHGSRVAFPPRDLELVQRRLVPAAVWEQRWRDWLIELGVPTDEHAELVARAAEMRSDAISVEPDEEVVDGWRAELETFTLRAIATPGHSPGQYGFVDDERGLYFPGDHVLPEINPNVSAIPGADADPLTDYLRSLARVRELDVRLVLPGHGPVFSGLSERVDEISAARRRRLDAVAALVGDEPLTTYELTLRYPWRSPWSERDPLQRIASLGEIHAHALALATEERIDRTPDGRFRRDRGGAR